MKGTTHVGGTNPTFGFTLRTSRDQEPRRLKMGRYDAVTVQWDWKAEQWIDSHAPLPAYQCHNIGMN